MNKIDNTGIEVFSDEEHGTNFMHAKVFVIDDRLAIISTANLSYSSFWRNREYWFVSEDEELVNGLSFLFDKEKSVEKIRKDDIPTSVLFCPLNCRSSLAHIVDQAEKRIEIQAQYIQDQELIDDLLFKQKEGVELRIIVGSNQKDGWLELFGT